MYQGYYHLRELPFELTPDPAYLFMSAQHREALSNLEYGLSASKSLTVLIGEAGTGKTTLLRAALQSERCRAVTCVYLNNPALTRNEFIYTLASRFGLGTPAAGSKAVVLEQLERVLHDRRAAGEIIALVVDEAQRLSTELLEEVRLLTNIETSTEKLLPLVLAGQPELGVLLEDPSLRQLKQRVALRCELAPFTLQETAAYIASRIRTAGGVPSRLFTQEAVVLIHEYAGGIPRTVSVICDNALVNGMAMDRQLVDRAAVLEVCRDFNLRRRDSAVPPAVLATPSHRQITQAPGGEQPEDVVAADDAPAVAGEAPRPKLFSLFTRRGSVNRIQE
jgi:general secretion pathway protein A